MTTDKTRAILNRYQNATDEEVWNEHRQAQFLLNLIVANFDRSIEEALANEETVIIETSVVLEHRLNPRA